MELIAIKKNNKYYCRHNGRYSNNIPDEDKLRFNIPRIVSFNEKWAVFEKLPTSAEECIKGRCEVVEYQLKDGYEVTDNTPSILPFDAFSCSQWDSDEDCIEYKNQDIKGLYNVIKVRRPDVWKLIKLEVDLIDEDCEPLVNPKYKFKSEFPYYIENHEVVRHKYPCHIVGKELFQLIRTSVKEKLPEHCVVTSDYDFSFIVKTKIPIIHEETYRSDVSSFNAKKSKWVDKPLRKLQHTIIEIQTEKRYSGTVIQAVKADNYEQLEKKVDDIIQEYIDMMKWKPIVCPHCKGYGWIQDLE